jgi:hypothetical protein
VGFDKIDNTGQFFSICEILEKKWEYSNTVHQVCIDFRTVYDSFRSNALYTILFESGIPVKKLMKMCLYETYIIIHIGRHLCDVFPIQNSLKRGGTS